MVNNTKIWKNPPAISPGITGVIHPATISKIAITGFFFSLLLGFCDDPVSWRLFTSTTLLYASETAWPIIICNWFPDHCTPKHPSIS